MSEKALFDSSEFEENYHFSGDLGALWSEDRTEFRLWAPTASGVVLFLYPAGDGCEAERSVPLIRGDRGVWTASIAGDLHGKYYDYDVTVDGQTSRTADCRAKACGVNGNRSMVVDLSRTDPEGWTEDRPPERQTEDIIYEMSFRDISDSEDGGFDPGERGKYMAMIRTGTTLNGEGIYPTGLDYIRSLGVTCVQLMPCYDFGSVNETDPAGEYNWGYDPVNYDVPEGSYASDPYHGEVRILELKEAVAAFHRAGLRVIMDVVYNHTFRRDSWLQRTVPGYFYRQTDDGEWSNGSGCGNDIACERSMCAKYILDSVLYWAEEYHMDGFRFDLMGLLDVSLMNRIRQALDERYGPGEKILYGEPWSADQTHCRADTWLADKGGMDGMNENIGAFCDWTRDAIAGPAHDPETPGLVCGGEISASLLACCVRGWAGVSEEFCLAAPSQTVNYNSSHDDMTLWDKLNCTCGPDEANILRSNRMAAAVLFFCQGRLFLLSGEEAARTKQGSRNSYCSPPEINRIDWSRMWQFSHLADYYRGLIALRKQLPGLTDKSRAAGDRILEAENLGESCSMVRLSQPEHDTWWQLMLLVNAGDEKEVELPGGVWQFLADTECSTLWEGNKTISGTVTVPRRCVWILGRLH